MFLRRNSVNLLLLGLFVAGLLPILHVRADNTASWLSNEAPALQKVTDLGGNVTPDSHNTDCSKSGYTLPDNSIRWMCLYESPLGTLDIGGDLQIGINKYAQLYGPGGSSGFLPSPDSSTAIVTYRSSQIGNTVGIYRHLTKSALHKDTNDSGTYYYVTADPDAILRNPVTHAPLAISTPSIGYSANGRWMVVNMPQTGLLRVDLEDLSTKLFAKPLEPSWFLGIDSPPLAISNDGRFVAANTGLFGSSSLNMYDLSTCEDQLNVTINQQWCEGRNILEGQTLDGQADGKGLTTQVQDLQGPVYLRFVDDETLSFDAKYDVISNTTYKVGQFVAVAPGAVHHNIGLLGLGDSYISGQGAFNYRDGTDTPTNTCHLSAYAYPFTLGRLNFNAYNSIACSGAITSDVAGNNVAYTGQATDKIQENNRDKQAILSNFQPGYVYQQEFSSTYKPEAMLLSVGGDDIGFADIVKSCVANEGGGTCYDTYEDRAELMQEINQTYGKLVNTYETLRAQSAGGRLYVVGYPQIAYEGGDCGANVHLNATEITFSNQLIAYLDSVVSSAAKTAGVYYVDTQHAFDGHRLCEPGEKAMNGLTAGKDAGIKLGGHPINFIGAESYHPTKLGYQLLANTIAASTANLTAPMPAPAEYREPSFDSTAPLLQGVRTTGRKVNVVTYDKAMASEYMVRGEEQSLQVDGTATRLQPGSAYQVVLHSDPVVLSEGVADQDGNITSQVLIPPTTEPGYHTLHIYGINMAGEAIDIQRHVFVAASTDHYYGVDSTDGCEVVADSGQDMDDDGIDDACDPVIDTTKEVSVTGEVSVQTRQTTVLINGVGMATKVENVHEGGMALGATTQSSASSTSPGKRLKGSNPQKLYTVDWPIVIGGMAVVTSIVACCLTRQR